MTVCGVDYPIDVKPSPVNFTGTPTDNQSNLTGICLSGNEYIVQSGDDCQKISTASGVSTGALRTINGIFPDCSNLIAGETLCVHYLTV